MGVSVGGSGGSDPQTDKKQIKATVKKRIHRFFTVQPPDEYARGLPLFCHVIKVGRGLGTQSPRNDGVHTNKKNDQYGQQTSELG